MLFAEVLAVVSLAVWLQVRINLLPKFGVTIQISADASAMSRRQRLEQHASSLVRCSVADSSARTFQPGITAYKAFCELHAVDSLHPSAEDMVLFATDLSESKSMATINVYLAAVRHFLLCQGKPTQQLRSARLTAVLRGIERSSVHPKQVRRAMTLEDMVQLRRYLARSNFSDLDRLMLWASVTTAFHGLLRSSEYLAPETAAIDPKSTLLWQYVEVNPGGITLQLRRTKTCQNGDGGMVVLRPASDEMCPVRAMLEFSEQCKLKGMVVPSSPVFRFQSGKFLTRSELTTILRVALQSTTVSSHSMRIGGATHMAAGGAAGWAIKQAGRWRSGAFNRYVRQPAGMPARE